MADESRSSAQFSAWDSGQDYKADNSAFLPPRKRLLAGLKQNGGYSSSPSSHAFACQSTGEPKLSADLEGVNAQSNFGGGERGEGDERLGESTGKSTIVENSDSESQRQERTALVADCGSLPKEIDQKSKLRRFPKLESAASSAQTIIASSDTPVMAETFDSDTAAKGKVRKTRAVAKRPALSERAVLVSACGKPQRKLSGRRDLTRENERSRKIELKAEATHVPSLVDDEELARQLHRAMNSSPRISRSAQRANVSRSLPSATQSSFQAKHHRTRQLPATSRNLEKKTAKKPKCSSAVAAMKLTSVNTAEETPFSVRGEGCSEQEVSDVNIAVFADPPHGASEEHLKKVHVRLSNGNIVNPISGLKSDNNYSSNQNCCHPTQEVGAGKMDELEVGRSVFQFASLDGEENAGGDGHGSEKGSWERSLVTESLNMKQDGSTTGDFCALTKQPFARGSDIAQCGVVELDEDSLPVIQELSKTQSSGKDTDTKELPAVEDASEDLCMDRAENITTEKHPQPTCWLDERPKRSARRLSKRHPSKQTVGSSAGISSNRPSVAVSSALGSFATGLDS